METLEVCLGHITGRCSKCTPDDKNKDCPYYKPATIRTFEVVDYTEKLHNNNV